MEKRSQKQIILNHLSEVDGIWFDDNSKTIIEKINTLNSFIYDNRRQDLMKSSSTVLSPDHIDYQRSLMHFLLYYSSYPNCSFVYTSKDALFFGAFTGRKFNILMMSCAVSRDAESMLSSLNKLLSFPTVVSLVTALNIKKVLLRDISDEIVNILRDNLEKFVFSLDSLKQLSYATYDLKNTLGLKGSSFANLRWHLNKFDRKNHTIEVVDSKKEITSAVHLIGKWRRQAIKQRGFSFADVRSDKLGINLLAQLKETDISRSIHQGLVGLPSVIARVLKVDGMIAAVNIGFPLGIFSKQQVVAHAIGINNLSISHLAEYAQFEFWKQIDREGYRFVNDGPSWKRSLEIYKNKFRPIAKKRYYWATLSLT